MSVAIPFTSLGASGRGEAITTMFAFRFYFAADLDVDTADTDGVSTRTIACEGYHRVLLCAYDATGSDAEGDEKDILAVFGAGLGALYAVTLRSDGYVQIQYLDIGDAIITWTGAETLRNILGFTGSTTTILASAGSVVTAPFPPMAVIYATSVLDSTDWSPSPTDLALATTNGGQTYGYGSTRSLIRKRFGLGFHPRTWSEAEELECVSTPMFLYDQDPIEDASPWLEPRSFPAAGTLPPHTVHEMLVLSRTESVAVLFGRFQQIASTRRCDLGYWTAESSAVEMAMHPGIAQYIALSQRDALELTRTRILDMTGT